MSIYLSIAGTSYGLVSLSVSVCHKLAFYRNGWTDRAGFWHVTWLVGFVRPILHRAIRKFSYLQNKGTFLWNFVLNSGLRRFCFGISIVETCYQLSLTIVDGQSVRNWTVEL